MRQSSDLPAEKINQLGKARKMNNGKKDINKGSTNEMQVKQNDGNATKLKKSQLVTKLNLEAITDLLLQVFKR
jgi:hypothetical protein